MPLIYKVRFHRGPWREIGMLTVASPPGSISHVSENGQRDLILFSCIGATSIIGISRGGIDREVGPMRRIESLGFDIVATLSHGEEFEMPVKSDSGIMYFARWRHDDAVV